MKTKKIPDKFLQYLHKEIKIETTRNMKLQGILIDYDKENVMIEQKVPNNPKIFSKIITIPRYMVQNIEILGLPEPKPVKKASHKSQEAQIPQEIKGEGEKC
jgi:hypothetical protein